MTSPFGGTTGQLPRPGLRRSDTRSRRPPGVSPTSAASTYRWSPQTSTRQLRPRGPGPARRHPSYPHQPRRQPSSRREGQGSADYRAVASGPRHLGRLPTTIRTARGGACGRPGRRPRPDRRGPATLYVGGHNASLRAVRQITESLTPVDTALLFAGAPASQRSWTTSASRWKAQCRRARKTIHRWSPGSRARRGLGPLPGGRKYASRLDGPTSGRESPATDHRRRVSKPPS